MNEPTLAKWLRWMVYTAALVPLIIFAQYMSPFHFGKVIVLRTIVEAMAALYLLLIWRNPEYRPKSNPITWAFLAFTLAFTLTTFTSVSPLQSIWGTLERMGGLFTFWHYFVFYLIAVSVLRTRGHWRTLLDLMVSVGLVSAIYGLLQKTGWSFILGSGDRTRPFGTIGNAALFAGYQILIAFMACTLWLMPKFGPASGAGPRAAQRGWMWVGIGLFGTLLFALAFNTEGLWVVPVGLVSYGLFLLFADAGGGRWFYAGSAALMFLAIATTAVRGSMLGVAVAVVVFLLLWTSVNRSRRGRLLLLWALSAVALFFFLAITLRGTSFVKNSPYLSRITDFSSSTFTVQTRIWAWTAGIQGWSESPRYMIVGWGPENFNIPFSEHFNPKFFTGPGAETLFDRAHNMFVEVLVTMGLVGELAYLSMFVALIWTLWKFTRATDERRTLGIGFIALTVGYVIHNCFIFDTSANFLTFFMLLAFVVHVTRSGLEEHATEAPKKTAAKPWTVAHVTAAVVLTVGVIVMVYRYNVKPTLANFASTRAIVAGWQNDFNGAVAKYREAIDYHTAGRYEFRNRFAQYLLETAASTDVSKIPGFNDVLKEAIADVGDNITESPHDYLPLLYTSRMYLVMAGSDPKSPFNDIALQFDQQALAISPTFVRTYYEIAQAYLNKDDLADAYQWFDKARQLNPDVAITYWYLGVVDIQRGNTKQGLAEISTAIQDGYQLSESDAVKLAGTYAQQGDIKDAVLIYEQLTSQFPSNISYWEQLISGYIQLQDKDKTISAIRAALAQPGVGTDAKFKASATQVLQQLGVTP